MQVHLQAPHPRRSVMWELALGLFAYIKTIIHSSIYHHPVLSSQGHCCDSGGAPPPMSWRPGWRVQLPHRVEHNFPFRVQHITSTHNSIRVSTPQLFCAFSSHCPFVLSHCLVHFPRYALVSSALPWPEAGPAWLESLKETLVSWRKGRSV
jgi:hypothetical protein